MLLKKRKQKSDKNEKYEFIANLFYEKQIQKNFDSEINNLGEERGGYCAFRSLLHVFYSTSFLYRKITLPVAYHKKTKMFKSCSKTASLIYDV